MGFIDPANAYHRFDKMEGKFSRKARGPSSVRCNTGLVAHDVEA